MMSELPEQKQSCPQYGTTNGIVASGLGAETNHASIGRAIPEGFLGATGAGERMTPAPLSAAAILRQKWVLLATFVLISSVTVPVIWSLVTPEYRATAAVRVRPTIPRIVFDVPEKNGMVPLYTSYLNTQVSILRSKQVLERVLDCEEVKATEWYRQSPRSLRVLLGGSSPNRMERLRDSLEAGPRRNTELVDVAMAARFPGDAKIIVDAVVEEYKRYTDEELSEHEKLVFDTLRSERSNLLAEINSLVEKMGNLSKQIGTGDPDIVRAQLAERLSLLETERERLQRMYTLAQEELASSGGQEDVNPVESVEPDSLYLYDHEWRALNMALRSKQHELVLAQQQYGESHPRIKQLVADVDHAERVLRSREIELDHGLRATDRVAGSSDPTMPLDRSDFGRLVARYRRELELMEEQIVELQKQQEHKGELAKAAASINQQLEQKQELYDLVRSRLQALEMEEKAPGRISVASSGIEPSKPFRDRRPLLTVLALGGAMMTGLALSYVRVTTDTRIREAIDVQQVGQVPFLGQLPLLPAKHDLRLDCPPIVAQHVRMVRTALLERLGHDGQHAVLVTSSTMQAGKSILSVLLAKSLAAVGKRVLLVEADLYRPSLSAYLNLRPEVGLPDVLTGQAQDREAILPTGFARLDTLLVNGPSETSEYDLLANGVFSACLRRWKKAYDFVLLDGPPVLPVADARILAKQADGTLMVLRSSHSRRAEAAQTFADLSAAGGRLLGTVLVGTRSEGMYAPYYAYGSIGE